MDTIKLDYKGIDLTVTYDYESAEMPGSDSPGNPETAAICEIFIGKTEISPLFNQEQMRDLEKAILTKLNER